jgi:hypothetical protein
LGRQKKTSPHVPLKHDPQAYFNRMAMCTSVRRISRWFILESFDDSLFFLASCRYSAQGWHSKQLFHLKEFYACIANKRHFFFYLQEVIFLDAAKQLKGMLLNRQ